MRFILVLLIGALLIQGCSTEQGIGPGIVRKEKDVQPQVAQTTVPQTERIPDMVARVETPERLSSGAAQPAAAAGYPAAASGRLGEELSGESIHFDFDSAALNADARNRLARIANLLGKDSAVKVRLEGNCDELGSDEYNLALGDRRALAAKSYLVALGIASDRLTTLSYGKEKPIDGGHDEAARARNRRVDFVVERY